MSNPFFLTRQSANLMEDFAREIAARSTLFLLYGDAGIGKSCLLQELQRTRLSKMRCHSVEMKPADDNTPDRSLEIIRIFESAAPGDVIIADHFELAYNKSRHVLFLGWAKHGADKKLNLIVSSVTSGFSDVRQLALQYKVKVQVIQQRPLTREEVDAFICYYLFSDSPPGKLTMPQHVRMQLTNAQGNIGKVIEIADRDSEQIKYMPAEDSESKPRAKRNFAMLAVLAAVVVLMAVGAWYLKHRYFSQEVEVRSTTAPPQPVVSAAAQPDAGTAVAANTPVKVATPTELAAVSEPAVQEKIATKVTADAEASVAVVASKPVVVAEPTQPEQKPILESQPEVSAKLQKSSDQPIKVEQVETEVTSAVSAKQHSQRFQQQLKESLAWLRDKKDSHSTIQIVWMGSNKFTDKAYNDYIEKLTARRVDITKVHVFTAIKSNKVVYNVIYGDYPSRNDALNSIKTLPDVLRQNSPFPRTFGGIRNEFKP